MLVQEGEKRFILYQNFKNLIHSIPLPISLKIVIDRYMTLKPPKDVKSLEINGFPIHIELDDSNIIIKDESGNSMIISKKDRGSIILDLNGSFKSSSSPKKDRIFYF
jgi:hypothetical protein